MNRKIAAGLTALLLVGLGAMLYFFWPFGNHHRVLTLPGIVEIQEVRLASKVGGRVAQVHVREGDTVEPGTALVTFEVPELEQQIAQQTAQAEALRQDWVKAKEGNRAEEIAQ